MNHLELAVRTTIIPYSDREDMPSKRGQAYNLNLAGSNILAPDGRCIRHNCPKCYARPKTSRVFWGRKISMINTENLAANLQV